MKMKILYIVILMLLITSALSATSIENNSEFDKERPLIISLEDCEYIQSDKIVEYQDSIDDLSTRKILEAMNLEPQETNSLDLLKKTKMGEDYPIGETIWQYTLTIYDPSPKAIAPIEDVDGDEIGDVIVCSEDDYVRCFEGGAIGTGNWIWQHEIYAGDIYSQKGLDIIEDVDDDGVEDIVVGATGGARLIRCISGSDGSTIWTHDTHEYGGGGWVYQVDCSYDYNGDGVTDVLATCGDDSSDTGPKRVYCLDGENGASIWERPLGGPGFAVIGVEDFTGDEVPDVVAGCSNEQETIGYAKGINGDTGAQVWSKTVPGSSVWGLEQIEDITDDGIKDVIIGDFYGNIFGLDATNGGQEYSLSIGTAIITRLQKINDVDYSGHPEIVPAHSSVHITQLIDAEDGDIIWSHPVADQPWNVARISDVSGDGIDDVLVGTLFNTNYCYFLDGTDGSELESIAYGQAVDAINAIPDVVADGSMEMVAGGRNGRLTCISGGLDAAEPNNPPSIPTIDGPSTGSIDWEYCFTIISNDPDEDNLFYYIDWGDGTVTDWIGPYSSGENVTVCHIFTSPGIYSIRVKVKDDEGAESDWSDPFEIIIVENQAPGKPNIDGQNKGKPNTEYEYTFVANDEDGDNITYIINWGDDSQVELLGPSASGEEVVGRHIWAEKGVYIITVIAKDIYDVEGEPGTLEVSMPMIKEGVNTFIHWIFERFSFTFPIISYVLGI